MDFRLQVPRAERYSPDYAVVGGSEEEFSRSTCRHWGFDFANYKFKGSDRPYVYGEPRRRQKRKKMTSVEIRIRAKENAAVVATSVHDFSQVLNQRDCFNGFQGYYVCQTGVSLLWSSITYRLLRISEGSSKSKLRAFKCG